MRAKIFASLAASAIALIAAAPAHAAAEPWTNSATSDFDNNFHLGCVWDDLNGDDAYYNDWWNAGDENVNNEVTIDTCIYTYVYDDSLDISHYERYIGGDGTATDGNGDPIGSFIDAPFCSSGWGIDLDTVTDSTVEIDSHGDKVFVITGTYNGLDVTGELRMYSEQDLLRWHWTFTNNTGSDINATNVELDNGDSQDNYGDGTTSDGDQVWETSDWYGTMFDSDETIVDGNRTAIATAFVGGNGEIDITSIDNDDVITGGDELYVDYDFDVAPGETKELIWFLSSSDYVAGETEIASDSVDPLVADFEDGVVQGRYARGLTDNDNSNWDVINPEVIADGDLAATGVDASGIALVGLLALATGVAFAVRRRVGA